MLNFSVRIAPDYFTSFSFDGHTLRVVYLSHQLINPCLTIRASLGVMLPNGLRRVAQHISPIFKTSTFDQELLRPLARVQLQAGLFQSL